MRDPLTRRLSSLGAAFAIALGGGAIAVAAGAPNENANPRAAEAQTEAQDNAQDDDFEFTEDVNTEDLTGPAEPEGGNENEEPSDFSVWVQEIQSMDLPGCIRGQWIAEGAKTDKTEGSLSEVDQPEAPGNGRCAEAGPPESGPETGPQGNGNGRPDVEPGYEGQGPPPWANGQGDGDDEEDLTAEEDNEVVEEEEEEEEEGEGEGGPPEGVGPNAEGQGGPPEGAGGPPTS